MIRSRRGFTMVEMVVVVAIVGILAGFAFPRLQATRQKAVATQAIGAVTTIRQGLLAYFAEKNTWPDDAARGVVPSGLETYVTSGTFQTSAYQIEYSVVTLGTDQVPAVVIYPVDPDVCAPLYQGLGGAANVNAFASCDNSTAQVLLYLN